MMKTHSGYIFRAQPLHYDETRFDHATFENATKLAVALKAMPECSNVEIVDRKVTVSVRGGAYDMDKKLFEVCCYVQHGCIKNVEQAINKLASKGFSMQLYCKSLNNIMAILGTSAVIEGGSIIWSVRNNGDVESETPSRIDRARAVSLREKVLNAFPGLPVELSTTDEWVNLIIEIGDLQALELKSAPPAVQALEKLKGQGYSEADLEASNPFNPK